MRKMIRLIGIVVLTIFLHFKIKSIGQSVFAQECGDPGSCNEVMLPGYQYDYTGYFCTAQYPNYFYYSTPGDCYAAQCTNSYWRNDIVCEEDGQYVNSVYEYIGTYYCDTSIIIQLPDCCSAFPPGC